MLKFYNVYTTTYHNNTKIGTTRGRILTDEKVEDNRYELTWDNLEDMYYRYGIEYKFNVWNMKKGRLVSFFYNDRVFPAVRGDWADVKEWKSPLNITITITYKEWNPSLNQILDWSDGEKAIQYLIEKGLDIAPKV